MKTRKLNVEIICTAVYRSKIEVPADLTLEEAIQYANDHMDEINVSELDWIYDNEIVKEECDFEKMEGEEL